MSPQAFLLSKFFSAAPSLRYTQQPLLYGLQLCRFLSIGDSASLRRQFTAADVKGFADVSGDTNALHLDDDYAKTTRFGGCIVHGMLMNGAISALIANTLPGKGTIYLGQEIKFKAPLYVGDHCTVRVEVLEIRR
eukprot:m.79085 g.79085  ORF g.79085 m.79085 type:complete len:135 (+) comp12701_c0_seq1:106-510(+)